MVRETNNLKPNQSENKPDDLSCWYSSLIEQVLAEFDILSNIAHVKMLGEVNIIDKKDADRLVEGLKTIKVELSSGTKLIESYDTDIHEAIERRLKELVGDIASSIRIAKSHNDQIATDIRLWLRENVLVIFAKLNKLRQVLIELAKRDLNILMPGYTHMQPAQPILLSHWWLANEARYRRDYGRLKDFYPRLNMLPLGACVLAGTNEPIDRTLVAKYLGFDELIENSLDAVSDRDFLIEFAAFATLCGLHLSQMSSELLLWATREYGFIKLKSAFTTASQHLPGKRNPELLEILRARPSVIYGHLLEFVAQLKALPIGYSQDLQECLKGLFDVTATLNSLIELSCDLLPGIEIDANRMRERACADLTNVGNAFSYLISKGISEEQASKTVESIGNYCQTRNKYLSDLELNEWQQFSPAFETDVYEHVTVEESVGAICSFGGSSIDQVELALNRANEILANDAEELSKRANDIFNLGQDIKFTKTK
jgi:argininosuccinate lyase